jgi:hypothetical protein
MTAEAVYDALSALNVSEARVTFSGGNDEGGADALSLIKADDPTVTYDVNLWGGDDEKVDKDLVQRLCEPIYDQYGSFAGEFSVYGTLIWNVTTRKCYIDGQESVETYNDFHTEISG